jgi:hypothetical protein
MLCDKAILFHHAVLLRARTHSSIILRDFYYFEPGASLRANLCGERINELSLDECVVGGGRATPTLS